MKIYLFFIYDRFIGSHITEIDKYVIENSESFSTEHSTYNKLVISVPIKDGIYNHISSGLSFTIYPVYDISRSK